MFLASAAFYLTFALTRAITHAIRAGVGPFHDVAAGGVHVHHLVWGILLLLGVGYLWLHQIGAGWPGEAPQAFQADRRPVRHRRRADPRRVRAVAPTARRLLGP